MATTRTKKLRAREELSLKVRATFNFGWRPDEDEVMREAWNAHGWAFLETNDWWQAHGETWRRDPDAAPIVDQPLALKILGLPEADD